MEEASGDGRSLHIPEGSTHTCRTGKGQKPDIVDYFGVKLVLNIDFESVVSRQLIGKISKRSRHKTNALLGLNAHHTGDADPALWNEARRKSRGTGKYQGGMLQICKRVWFPGRGKRVGPRFEDLE